MADNDVGVVDLGNGWQVGPYATWSQAPHRWLLHDGTAVMPLNDDVAAMLRGLAARLAIERTLNATLMETVIGLDRERDGLAARLAAAEAEAEAQNAELTKATS